MTSWLAKLIGPLTGPRKHALPLPTPAQSTLCHPSPTLVAVEMLRGPAAAVLRRLAPRVSGGGATHRRVPPPIAPALLARFSSTPATSSSSPPPPSSAAGRDEEPEDKELPDLSNGDAGSRLSISVDRSGLYNPPGSLRLCLSLYHTHASAQLSGSRDSDVSSFFDAAEHSHEPSSDSELVKHLKSIIKVPSFVSLLIYVARNAEMWIGHFGVVVVLLVSEWADQCSRIHGGGANEPTIWILYQPWCVRGRWGFHYLAGGQPDVRRGNWYSLFYWFDNANMKSMNVLYLTT